MDLPRFIVRVFSSRLWVPIFMAIGYAYREEFQLYPAIEVLSNGRFYSILFSTALAGMIGMLTAVLIKAKRMVDPADFSVDSFWDYVFGCVSFATFCHAIDNAWGQPAIVMLFLAFFAATLDFLASNFVGDVKLSEGDRRAGRKRDVTGRYVED